MSGRLRRVIAWWQIVCGILGYLMVVMSALDWPQGSRHVMTASVGAHNVAGAIVFFGLCILLGIRLLRSQRAGYIGSAAVQGVQVLSIAILGGPHVVLQAGPKIALTVAATHLNFGLGFTSTFFLGTRIAGPAWEVTLNVLALVWTVLLVRAIPLRPVIPAVSAAH